MNFRITEQLRLEGLSEGRLVWTLLKPGWSRAGYSGSSPVSFWIYSTSGQLVPVFDNSQIKKVFFLCVSGISFIWICAHCLFSCQPKRVCLSHLYSMSSLSWAAQKWTQHCRCSLSSAELEGKSCLSCPGDIQLMIYLAFLVSRACCWL